MTKILNRNKQNNWIKHTGAEAMLAQINHASINTIRLEIVWTVIFQVLLFLLINLSWVSWVLCYACFAVNWSSLQYADHAWSELDPKQGAWNLKINPVIRAIFLNYHLHHSHHTHPRLPWLYLSEAGEFFRPNF